VTTNQVLIGISLILVLAAGSQMLASRLKIPALIILLPAAPGPPTAAHPPTAACCSWSGQTAGSPRSP
jgi:hypothetical protein